MKFDWSNFTKENYKDMLNGNIGYCGAVHVGDICIEFITEKGTVINGINSVVNQEEYVMCNFYVADEDTGYGYKDDGMPYDYADGIDVKMPYKLSYDGFIVKVESLLTEYIETYNGDYSLVEHANRQLKMW